MKDRIREILFPLAILSIIASVYSLARANAFERKALDEGMPLVHDEDGIQTVATID